MRGFCGGFCCGICDFWREILRLESAKFLDSAVDSAAVESAIFGVRFCENIGFCGGFCCGICDFLA